MNETNTLIRQLCEDDLPALYRIRQIAFLDEMSLSDPQVQASHLATLTYKYGRFVDGRLASSASWYPFEMYLRGERTAVGGLASVVSAAESRRQGHVRALLGHGLEMLRDEGVAWCLEYPFDTRYYRSFGWETVANGFMVEVPIDRFRRFSEHATFRRVEADDEASFRTIRRIHANWAAGYNFTMARTESVRPDWERLLVGSPWHDGDARFTFVAEHAYCVLKITPGDDTQTLTLLDFAFETPAGRREIFAFMNNFAGQTDTVRLQLPADDPLVVEWPNFMVPNPHPLHARIVDAAAALSDCPVDEGVEFVVAIRDDFCTWNDANFLVEAQDGRSRATRVDAPAELSLDVRALAQILSGSVTASAAIRVGLADGDVDSITQLCSLATRPCYMPLSDYF